MGDKPVPLASLQPCRNPASVAIRGKRLPRAMTVVVAVPTCGNDVFRAIGSAFTPRDEMLGGGLKVAHPVERDAVMRCKLLGIVPPHRLTTIETKPVLLVELRACDSGKVLHGIPPMTNCHCGMLRRLAVPRRVS